MLFKEYFEKNSWNRYCLRQWPHKLKSPSQNYQAHSEVGNLQGTSLSQRSYYS